MYMYFLILFPLYIYDSNDQAAWTSSNPDDLCYDHIVYF